MTEEQGDSVTQDEAVEWLEEVKLAYRTDPFTAVISDLIRAGATNGALARTLPAAVQAELVVKHSEQRIRQARRQLHRFKFNKDGILQTGERLVIPEGRRLRLRLFEEFHNSRMGGHFGQEKTYLQLCRRFYWPDMEASVRRYVKGCDLCLRTKARQHAPFGLLEALDIPQERWKQVGIDFITKLPTTPAGNNAIVTIIDHLTKRAHFIPTTEEDLSAETFAQLFMKESVRLHGMPTKIISDRDPRFVSAFWKQLMQLLGTKLGMSTAYHPQTDGQSEKANDIVGTWLRAFARESEQTEWDRMLPIAEFAYNSTSQASTGKTPFELDLGYHPRWPLDLMIQTVVETPRSSTAVDFATRQQHNLQQAKDSLIRARDAQKELYDRQHLPHDFAIGDSVYLDTRDLPITYANNTEERSRKLQDRFAGPFEIVAASASPNAWVLNTPGAWKVHQPFNVSRFKKDTSDTDRQHHPPAMVHTARGSEYMLEKIVAREKQGNRWMYKVRWTGYEELDDTWEPLANLDGCKETVEEFHRENGLITPRWPRRIRRKQ